MTQSYYREKWFALTKDSVSPETIRKLSRQVAYSFLDYYIKDLRYEADYIDLLCEMTTFSQAPELANPVAQALFGIIVESLCDDFEELHTTTYNRVMAQVIDHCRRLPTERMLDEALKRFGVHTAEDLLTRIDALRTRAPVFPPAGGVHKVILLSRVTLGADVAITGVMLQRMSRLFPQAELVLVGGSKLVDLYGGNSRLRIREIDYSRKGGLLDRLSTWHDVLEVIREESAEGPPEGVILLDPDSRLSQLGVLPLFPSERYFLFDSRSHNAFNRAMSMPELANAWIDEVRGEKDFCYPQVWIQQAQLDQARHLCERLRGSGARRIIVVNFGVGGNPRKRVGRQLEEELLLELLKTRDTLVLLDQGFGDEEMHCAGVLLDGVSQAGHATQSSLEGLRTEPQFAGGGVVGLQCGIGEIAALIAHADEFIGYDSACQHIAAALETPCVTIFAGSNNTRFIRRWSAFGRRNSEIVHVDTLTDPSKVEVDDILTRIMHHRVAHEELSR